MYSVVHEMRTPEPKRPKCTWLCVINTTCSRVPSQRLVVGEHLDAWAKSRVVYRPNCDENCKRLRGTILIASSCSGLSCMLQIGGPTTDRSQAHVCTYIHKRPIRRTLHLHVESMLTGASTNNITATKRVRARMRSCFDISKRPGVT